MEDLARISFKHKPLYVGVDDGRTVATREGLEQGYCVVDADKRFLLLFTFLKKNANKKVRGEEGEKGGKGRRGRGWSRGLLGVVLCFNLSPATGVLLPPAMQPSTSLAAAAALTSATAMSQSSFHSWHRSWCSSPPAMQSSTTLSCSTT